MPVASKLAEQIGRSSWIRRMFEVGARLKAERGPENVFDFTLGNPDLEPPPALIEALARVAVAEQQGIHAYMPNAGYPHVRAEIARRLRERSGIPYEGDHVVMTVGAAGALNVVLKALLDPGDEVILLVPYFAEYEFYVTNHGGAPVYVETDARCQIDVDAVAKAVTPRTRAMIINSPNNPSGVVYPAALLAALGERIKEVRPELVVIVDEPYRALAFSGVEVPHVPQLIPRTIVASSWSKELAIPGERIGFLAIPPSLPEAAELCGACIFANRILGYVNAPALWQRAIVAAGPVQVDPAIYQERCTRTHAALTAMGYDAIRPEGGFYLFVRTPCEDLAFVAALQEEGILAVPGRGFGRPGWMRLSLTVPMATIERSFAGFERALGRARAGGIVPSAPEPVRGLTAGGPRP
jgi:aspartate aminotransferase